MCVVNMNGKEERARAPRNKTIALSAEEAAAYERQTLSLSGPVSLPEIQDKTIHQDLLEVIEHLPDAFVDLLFLDPPYNLTKSFGAETFKEMPPEEYAGWMRSWFPRVLRTLKSTASVYICGDWRSSAAIHAVASEHLNVRNRITWEREKGRGASRNWKNCSEDIWFCTLSDRYTFNVEAVKLKRKVIAPYRDREGRPKDWEECEGGSYRLTHPSNLWTDITVPFWSMSENTDHPTQKPEKLLARIILASSNPGDCVMDPFLGSGTTSVVAKKLGRRYVGVERDLMYCCLAEKRLALADADRAIQGYAEGVFWDRNALPASLGSACNREAREGLPLFGVGQETTGS